MSSEKPTRSDSPVARLAHTYKELGAHIDVITDQLSQLATELVTDALTGIGNKRALDEVIKHEMRPDGDDAAVIFLDLRDFKQINTKYKQAGGDAALAKVGERLRGLSHSLSAFRVGGDEFVILTDDAQNLLEHLAELLMPLSFFTADADEHGKGARVKVSVHATIGYSRDSDAMLRDLIAQAEEACSCAKYTKRGILEYQPGMVATSRSVRRRCATCSVSTQVTLPPGIDAAGLKCPNCSSPLEPDTP